MAKKTTAETPETLLSAILAMQKKITEMIPEFETAELTYTAEMGDGREIIRANPLVQEFRALVKDYSVALKAYKEISDGQSVTENSQLTDIRSRFKVAK